MNNIENIHLPLSLKILSINTIISFSLEFFNSVIFPAKTIDILLTRIFNSLFSK